MASHNNADHVDGQGSDSSDFQKIVTLVLEFMRKVVKQHYESTQNGGAMRLRDILSPKEVLIVDSFDRIKEIITSKDRIEQIRRLASIAPPAYLGMDRVEYLQFFVEAYYQELYILDSRIDRWISWHERKFQKKHPNRLTCERNRSLSRNAFKRVREVRGEHVHERRHYRQDV